MHSYRLSHEASQEEVEKDALVTQLKEFKEVFAWSYEDMPKIDTYIVQHCIPTNLALKLVKQKLRRNEAKVDS